MKNNKRRIVNGERKIAQKAGIVKNLIFYLSLFTLYSLLFTNFIGCKKSEEGKVEKDVFIVDSATAATISGKINFSGTAPKAAMISVSGDAYCSKQHTKASIASEELVVNPNKTLKNVLIYVKRGLEGKKFPVPQEPAVLDQHGCWYTPHVLALMVNQQLVVRNSDETLHNINARPKTNQGFNFAQPSKGMETKKSFTKEELGIPVKCDVHPWMGGYISVLPHPYFAVTGKDGSFTIKNLPPGEYEIEAWHEKLGTKSLSVKVAEKESKTVNFEFKI